MSIWGTTIGAILSLPIAVLSARNIASCLVTSTSQLFTKCCSFSTFNYFGFSVCCCYWVGSICGYFGLRIYTIGYLGKFYQEAIEAVNPRSLESLRVAGASKVQIVQYGIFPQILPLGLGYTLYMFDIIFVLLLYLVLLVQVVSVLN